MSRLIDLTGRKFNKLTVLKFAGVRSKNAYWECKCDCGNIKSIIGSDLKRGQTRSCGCATAEFQASKKFKDLTGNIYGRLTVIRFVRMTEERRMSIYECKCECGAIKEIERANLVRGHTTSCGCYNRDKQLKAHGVASFNNYIKGYKDSAAKRGYVFELTEDQFKEVIEKDCVICGAPPKVISRKTKNYSATPILANGIDRIDNTKGYIVGNIQPMCGPCNKAKSNLGEETYRKWIAQIRSSI
jgi:hypothetical protein